MKWNSRRIAEQFHEIVPYCAMIENVKRLKAKTESDEIDKTTYQSLSFRGFWRLSSKTLKIQWVSTRRN
ncbi:hypothetical protein H5410_002619 [Solanum commersonii]|uniref:Uncharacterized protein n=1 Tax=Solanum commersonii TaxID=4109 RepID=A0A9J6B2F7_SOLCO|nr:hypothetical protein H5410_002619 [Solanum commersonii]